MARTTLPCCVPGMSKYPAVQATMTTLFRSWMPRASMARRQRGSARTIWSARAESSPVTHRLGVGDLLQAIDAARVEIGDGFPGAVGIHVVEDGEGAARRRDLAEDHLLGRLVEGDDAEARGRRDARANEICAASRISAALSGASGCGDRRRRGAAGCQHGDENDKGGAHSISGYRSGVRAAPDWTGREACPRSGSDDLEADGVVARLLGRERHAQGLLVLGEFEFAAVAQQFEAADLADLVLAAEGEGRDRRLRAPASP